MEDRSRPTSPTCEKTRPRSCNYVQEDYSISFYRDDHPFYEMVLRDAYDYPSNGSTIYRPPPQYDYGVDIVYSEVSLSPTFKNRRVHGRSRRLNQATITELKENDNIPNVTATVSHDTATNSRNTATTSHGAAKITDNDSNDSSNHSAAHICTGEDLNGNLYTDVGMIDNFGDDPVFILDSDKSLFTGDDEATDDISSTASSSVADKVALDVNTSTLSIAGNAPYILKNSADATEHAATYFSTSGTSAISSSIAADVKDDSDSHISTDATATNKKAIGSTSIYPHISSVIASFEVNQDNKLRAERSQVYGFVDLTSEPTIQDSSASTKDEMVLENTTTTTKRKLSSNDEVVDEMASSLTRPIKKPKANTSKDIIIKELAITENELNILESKPDKTEEMDD